MSLHFLRACPDLRRTKTLAPQPAAFTTPETTNFHHLFSTLSDKSLHDVLGEPAVQADFDSNGDGQLEVINDGQTSLWGSVANLATRPCPYLQRLDCAQSLKSSPEVSIANIPQISHGHQVSRDTVAHVRHPWSDTALGWDTPLSGRFMHCQFDDLATPMLTDHSETQPLGTITRNIKTCRLQLGTPLPDDQDAGYDQSHPPSQSSVHGKRPSSTNRQSARKRSKTQKQLRQSGHGRDEHSDSEHEASTNGNPTPASELEKNFSCPFFKMYPVEHLACASCAFQDYPQVRGHLKRKHHKQLPFTLCERCQRPFETDRDHKKHLELRPRCTKETQRNAQLTHQSLSQQVKGTEGIHRWNVLCQTLFPEAEGEVPDPLPLKSIVQTRNFLVAWCQRLPESDFRTRLEAELVSSRVLHQSMLESLATANVQVGLSQEGLSGQDFGDLPDTTFQDAMEEAPGHPMLTDNMTNGYLVSNNYDEADDTKMQFHGGHVKATPNTGSIQPSPWEPSLMTTEFELEPQSQDMCFACIDGPLCEDCFSRLMAQVDYE